jgi:hypothetical protein
MNLEQSVKDTISKQIEGGMVERVIAEKLEKGVEKALDDMFCSWNGDVAKTIKKELEAVVVPFLEGYDYSNYVVKLDHVLTNILKQTNVENNQLLENFKELMTTEEFEKEIKISNIKEKWAEFAGEEIETTDLEICYDDEVSYEMVEASMVFEQNEERSWSTYQQGMLVFECEQDPKLNREIEIYRFTDMNSGKWKIRYAKNTNIESIRGLDSFEIYLMRLEQARANIELDETDEYVEIYPKQEPEASFS